MTITSVTNARVKQVIRWRDKAKERRADNVYLVEGVKMYEEAPKEDICEVYISESLRRRLEGMNGGLTKEDSAGGRWIAKMKAQDSICVSDEVFAKMSDTQSPQGILTVLSRKTYDRERILSEETPLLLLLEDLQDPGNLGTIIRTAEGAGVTGVVMSERTVDIFNPKTIRATMGSVYRVPFVYEKDICGFAKEAAERGIHLYAAHLKGKEYYDSAAFDFRKPTAFLIGNEGNGLSEELAGRAERYVKIPMEGQVESLNAAVAASLLIYEAHRQRNLSALYSTRIM